jgi:hypothetical protein
MGKHVINVQYIKKNDENDIKYFYNVSYERWNNAIKCFNNGDYFIALYLAGYSVECILKYAIWETLFPDKSITRRDLCIKDLKAIDAKFEKLNSHDLAGLIELGNNKDVFIAPTKSDFKEVIKWTSEWRYAKVHNIHTKEVAKEFLESVVELSSQLKDNIPRRTKLKVFKFNELE